MASALARSKAIPTWEETKNHLREKFMIALEEPEWLGLGWKFKSADGQRDVLQRQRVELAQAFGKPHLVVISDIAEVDRVPERTVLKHNMTLAIGAAALLDNTIVLRAVLPLTDLTWERLDQTLEYLAHEAARLRDSTPA